MFSYVAISCVRWQCLHHDFFFRTLLCCHGVNTTNNNNNIENVYMSIWERKTMKYYKHDNSTHTHTAQLGKQSHDTDLIVHNAI